ncbi:IS1182 family transposase [Rhodococcus sp. T2V]|uniref:IS1182 family transposase n=1 Tax=Rhodococcus sp. T2V TaxID=3034164 RepID=UPI0023E15792|nr:IS1182 family transposase [Rhodococcus sp. T2V]MDF3313703.1 IS1182 family transposase [Rhodococcus sp. T2V]
MQGNSDSQRDLWDVSSVAGHLLPEGSVFSFLAEHRYELFPPELFTDLFPSTRGRPSLAPEVVASVLVLQALHGLSDRAAAEAVTFDLRWKAACGLPVDGAAFHPTVLTYWRKRLAASARPNRIFEVVKEVIADTGVLKGRTRRALDSTVLDDAVATQDTVTQLVAAIRRVAALVPGAADVVARLGTACDYSTPGKPDIAWEDKAARDQLVDALVRDAVAIGAALTGSDTDPVDPDSPAGQALALLALVAGQDVEWVTDDGGGEGGGGRWRIARKVAPDRVISTVDTETRHARKTRSRRQDGYKGHIAAEPDTGLITAAKLTKAAGRGSGDAEVGGQLLADDDTLDGPAEVLGDSAYGSGQLLDDLTEAGHDPVIKPKPVPTPTGLEDAFTADEFTVDHDRETVTCPNSETASFANTPRTATFGRACTTCPFRSRCTNSVRGRTVHVGEHDRRVRAHRARWARDEQMRRDYRQHRPMIERSIAWMTRGARTLRYRGVAKNDAWWNLRAAAVNLHRLTGLGLSIEDGMWALG